MGRGPHPRDTALFAPSEVPRLREAVEHLSWLLSRGYAEPSALKLVGDRHALRERQRIAVRRCAAADTCLDHRAAKRLEPTAVRGRRLAVDGFNCLITVETALGGGVLLRGRDRALRDMASVHGSYRRVEATASALRRLAQRIEELEPASALWLLDRPVSNSGRVASLLREVAPSGLAWDVELVFDPDRELPTRGDVVASGDASVLDRSPAWIDLPSSIVERWIPDAWVLDLGDGSGDDGAPTSEPSGCDVPPEPGTA